MKNEVKIALNICTFQREEFIHRNLSLLQASDFFNPDNPQYYGRLHIFVVDNGSSLQLPESPYVHCIYNRNTGGSGGFQRGIEEIRKRNEGFTHVIFMDDDVAFDISSFYLLFDFLSGVGEADRNRPVAGRMFCMDDPYIQYTAAEKWNRGMVSHVEFMRDVRGTAYTCLLYTSPSPRD